jgi:hypothetical protein
VRDRRNQREGHDSTSHLDEITYAPRSRASFSSRPWIAGTFLWRDIIRSLPGPLDSLPAVCGVVSVYMSDRREREMIAHGLHPIGCDRSKMTLRDSIACAGS